MLTVKDLNKSFGTPPHQVLFDINLTIETGELVSITGRSGSGKSTLLYLLSTLDQPDNGSISIDGNDIPDMTEEEIHHFRNKEMGFVFQFHYLLPEFTALENILMPALKAKVFEEKREQAEELLKKFDLGQKGHRLPRQLSGGEQQRVAIARALIMNPAYLFADEPTGNLDSVNGKVVVDILKEIAKELKTTVIYVTHEKDYAAQAQHRIELSDGRVSLNLTQKT
jgi:putative ABC transport system ATP-binding protein/lipoprotein-releasing system ATP-binding protein